jgi:hypothetical protein
MILSFLGERKSGKDYLCDFLVREYGAVRLSFSDEVRHLAVKVFPWLPFDFDPSVKDLPFVHEKNPNNLTPRQIWVDVIGKVRNVTPNYFVEAFEERNKVPLQQMHRTDRLYLITDFRTPQEWVFLKKYKIPVIKIVREDRTGIPPDAFEDYVRQFTDYNAVFKNRLNGTSEFNRFFKDFLGLK